MYVSMKLKRDNRHYRMNRYSTCECMCKCDVKLVSFIIIMKQSTLKSRRRDMSMMKTKERKDPQQLSCLGTLQ